MDAVYMLLRMLLQSLLAAAAASDIVATCANVAHLLI